MNIAENLALLRSNRGLTQAQLAHRARLSRQQITFFESGARVPSLTQTLRIAAALDVSLEQFLYGANAAQDSAAALAIELRHLGLIDLWVESPLVPGSLRRPEEVLALVVSRRTPDYRILEALPPLLAWNRWSNLLLHAFARLKGRSTVYRLAWLSDIVLAIDRQGGFPGGCAARDELARYLKRVKPPSRDRWDSLGTVEDTAPSLPIWKRWRISYPATLETFRARAESLIKLAKAEGRALPAHGGSDAER